MGLMPRPPAPVTTPLEATLARVGDRWSLLVVDALLAGPARFQDLQEGIPGIATNILTQRLRHLEAERVVVATPYSRRPARYTYQLTSAGQALAGALRLLAQWGAEQEGAPAAGPVHGACGTPLSVRWYCPTCEVVAEEDPEAPVFV